MSRPFNCATYLSLLTSARQSGYDIRPIRDAFALAKRPRFLLRHDVDFSLRFAVVMAEVEHALGVSSTYFILPHNDFYTPFSVEGRQLVLRLTQLGHEIGLHWDSSLYPGDQHRFRQSVRRDLEALEDITESKIVSASQHIPIDTGFVDISDLIDIEVYSRPMRESFTYVSDSSMSWREVTPWDLIPQGRDIHFLAHPIWWIAEGETRDQKLNNLAEDIARHSESRIFAMRDYISKCLLDRERLDAQLRQTWKNQELAAAAPSRGAK